MADITLTSSIRTNLLSLQNTSKLLDMTANRLSTGKKVNSALDNPGSFFTARGLSNRAADLTKLKDGIGQAIQTLKTADQGLTSITNLVEQAKSIAEQAKEALAAQVAVSATTVAATISAGATGTASLLQAGILSGSETLVATVVQNGVTGAAITLTTAMTVASAATLLSAVSGVTLTLDTAADTFTLTTDDRTQMHLLTSTGETISAWGATTAAGTTFGTTSGPTTVEALAADYNKVLAQLDALVTKGDTSYKGINLLKSTDLSVRLSENKSNLTITGVDSTLAGLGLADATGWTTTAGIDADIVMTETATTKLRTFASSFGTDLSILQYREDYTTSLVNTLKDGSGLLVNASLEEEAANMLALQTRQSLGTQSLSIANQSQQSILSLFR